MELYRHQTAELEATESLTHVAYYHDMGLGKTFTGAEKMARLGARVNLIVCQKSKIDDWREHCLDNLPTWGMFPYRVLDITKPNAFDEFLSMSSASDFPVVGVINYELAWRRKELLKLQGFTLMLDESSMIQNERAKRSKFILKLQPANVILLSGTPTGGKYERLWSQLHLLGWNISRDLYWKQYVKVRYLDTMGGRSIPVVEGYKNVDRLKAKMAAHGCRFLKSDEVFDLPTQTFVKVRVDATAEYRRFKANSIVEVEGLELVGDTTLTKMLYERQLCGQYNAHKLQAFADLVDSTEDRLIVFYNFTAELEAMKDAIGRNVKRDVCYSVVNGDVKDLAAYGHYSDSVTFIQYQAGAMGLNLQKANKIIYFTLPLSSELFEQSKKRIHRIGQDRPCFYYLMLCRNSIEQRILKALEQRRDYTEKLFEKGE